MGELALQVRGDEHGSQRPSSKWKQGKTLWKMRDAKERCDAHHDQTSTSEQKIVNGDAVRQDLRNKHLQNQALAETETLRRVEVWDEAGSSTAVGISAEPFRDAFFPSLKSRVLQYVNCSFVVDVR